MTSKASRCAVVFKAYNWDSFVERQARRLAEAAGALDFFISLDETRGSAGPIPFEHVVRFTCADLETAGLAMRSPVGGVLWWNPDYAHYNFHEHFPDYQYYLFVEYDCVVQCSLEQLVDDAASKAADLLALPMLSRFYFWHWWSYQRNVYAPEEVQRALLCVCLLSSAALRLLYRRRLEMSQAGTDTAWPNSELFVASEVTRAGMKWLSLSDFGDLSNYAWFPPILEEDLRLATRSAFLHPVLDRKRYVVSMLDNRGSLPRGELERALSRFLPEEYLHIVKASARRGAILAMRHKVRRKVAQLLDQLELMKAQLRQHPFGR